MSEIDSKVNIEKISTLTRQKLLSKIDNFNTIARSKRRKPLYIELIPDNIWGRWYRKLGGIQRLSLETIVNNSEEYISEWQSELLSTLVFNSLLARKPRPDKIILKVVRLKNNIANLYSPDYVDIMVRVILPRGKHRR